MDEYLDFAREIAEYAGKVMNQYFEAGVKTTVKKDDTIVTLADTLINEHLIEQVAKKFPDHGVLGEEASHRHDNEKFLWVCDPIDGTVPYSKGLPISVFSLALVKDGEPVIGLILDPFQSQLYWAEKGKGAFRNDEQIHVSNVSDWRRAVINIEWWSSAKYDINTVDRMLTKEKSSYVLHLGSTTHAYALVASGQYEGCVFPGFAPHDSAAAKLLVEEAGGKFTDLYGSDQRYDGELKGAIASNGVLHDELLEVIKTAIK